MSALLLALLLSAPPAAALVDRDARGCARAVQLEGRWVPLAAAAAVCVEGAFLARLEGPAIDNLVLRVSGTRAASGHGLFVYRVERRTLVPRFLGSGFSGLRIDSAVAAPGAIEIEAHDGSGPSRFTCRFHGFPLVCSEKGLP